MINKIESIKQRLSEICDKKYVFLTGRGTTAIYLALRAIGRCTNGKRMSNIILPNLLCPSPADAVLYSNMKPLFCDINLHDYNMNIESLENVINRDTKAILAVHIFGHPCDMDEIIEIAEKRNLYVIEDCAQAIGGKYKCRKIGTMGDFVILSFGAKKIIDAGDGGALLTDSAKFARIIEDELKKLPPKPPNIDMMFNKYRKLFYKYIELNNQEEKRAKLLELSYSFKKMYIYKFDSNYANKICEELGKLQENTKKRVQNALLYRKMLRHKDIIHPQFKQGGTCYRYSILIKRKNVKAITEAIRKKGYDASNLYRQPLHEIYSNQKDQNFKNSTYVSKHIINLWVDPSITKEYINEVCNIILKELNNVY